MLHTRGLIVDQSVPNLARKTHEEMCHIIGKIVWYGAFNTFNTTYEKWCFPFGFNLGIPPRTPPARPD
jgi:hypothetical protein